MANLPAGCNGFPMRGRRVGMAAEALTVQLGLGCAVSLRRERDCRAIPNMLFTSRCGLTRGGSDGKKCESQRLGWHGGDRKWSLNDGQIPNFRVVRVALGTGYNRVEGNRRASRVSVSDLPPEIR